MAKVFNMSTINNIYGQKQSFLDAGIDLILGHRLIRLLIDCGDKTISRPSSNNGIAYMGKMTSLSIYIYVQHDTEQLRFNWWYLIWGSQIIRYSVIISKLIIKTISVTQ